MPQIDASCSPPLKRARNKQGPEPPGDMVDESAAAEAAAKQAKEAKKQMDRHRQIQRVLGRMINDQVKENGEKTQRIYLSQVEYDYLFRDFLHVQTQPASDLLELRLGPGGAQQVFGGGVAKKHTVLRKISAMTVTRCTRELTGHSFFLGKDKEAGLVRMSWELEDAQVGNKAQGKESAKAEKKRLQDEEKARKKQQKEAEGAALKAAEAEEKAETTRLRAYHKTVGDRLKTYVQGQCKSADLKMSPAEYEHVFRAMLHLECSKKITTESTYRDGSVTVTTQHVSKALYLSADQVASVFGVTETQGGSWNPADGQTRWRIASMVAKRTDPGVVSLEWTLNYEDDL
ncbi:unnamed protein product [Amoebophrya sp. A120]|nr:unnamed protein product [Amoebophrya sp. A120]|eukprot:GSA120T00024961001.1